ncbi:MAG: sigma-70 family RNA polymerase sigma factor [Prevotella sp.]|jgi:RNA polymerase sigma-70 factor (ECF subfamily)|nr:sigma-70 family RNA polymerase sigma factor [Prevotella sp.]MBQ6161419.1 sigma-70 family RNA polymerase sigma factor [Prevotella sp.]MBQ6188457.1 sigma-70 family RNA polymerase sigma factor [Prevotella sp.]
MNDLTKLTDEQLAMLYIDGNNRAFDLLLSRNQSRLFSYIIFVVKDRDVAEDIFQETFVKVITRLQQGRYVPSGKFAAWLMKISHNVIMDWYREQRSEKVVDASDNGDLSRFAGDEELDTFIEQDFVNNQIYSDVRHMMEMLPAVQREVVFMRYYQQLSFKEIAECTGVSINTALGRMRYAILNMRRMAKTHDVALQLV